MNLKSRLVALVVLCFLMSLSAVAKDQEKNHGSMSLAEPAQMGSTLLKPGDYKLVWDGNGPDVNVQIMQGRKTVATVPAKLVQREKASEQDQVILKSVGSGRAIDEVNFRNRTEAIVVGSGN